MLLQTLLIVDADALIRSSFRAYFEHQNYKVCEAGPIDEAVRNDLSAVAAIVCDDQLIEIIKLATVHIRMEEEMLKYDQKSWSSNFYS